jgi:hypothetical protein
MIRRGELIAIKVGRRYLIPESAIDATGFAELKLFADIKDASAYVRKIRRADEITFLLREHGDRGALNFDDGFSGLAHR